MPDYNELKQQFATSSDLLVALGDLKRQAIIIKLLEVEHICDGLQVPDLTEASGLSRPAVSHHLKVLRDAKLVDFKRVGTKNYYFLAHDLASINQLRQMLATVASVMEDHAE